MEPEKSLPLRPNVVCMPAVVVATKPVTMSRPRKSSGTSLRRLRFARGPLHRGAERTPFDDDDLRARRPTSTSPSMRRALAQEGGEQPGRPDLPIAGNDVAHRVGGRADETHGLQHAGDIAAIAREVCAVSLAGRARQELRRELLVAPFQLLDRRRPYRRRAAPPASRTEQRIGDAAARGQNDRLARIGGCLDDVGDAPEATRIGDARTAEFMYDPFVHISHAPNLSRRRMRRPKMLQVDELRP